MPSSELTADPLQRNTNKTSSGNLTEKDKDRPRDNMQSDARVPYVFSSVPPWAQTSSAGAKSPLCSTWNEKSAPQARLEKKPIQNRAVHKSLAHVDRGRRLPGAEQQHTRQTDRQTGSMPTQTVSDEKPCFGEEHSTQKQKLASHETTPFKI